MKNLIKEVNKISLTENEFLCIKMNNSISGESLAETFDNLEKIFPEEWMKRIFIVNGDVEITKITKE